MGTPGFSAHKALSRGPAGLRVDSGGTAARLRRPIPVVRTIHASAARAAAVRRYGAVVWVRLGDQRM